MNERLASTRAAGERQKAWFAEFRAGVLERGEPYVIADAVAPHEIFHAMDIPVVSVVWYAAVVAAKRLSSHYLDFLATLGYHDALPRYTSLPMAVTLEGDAARAPYGGLPKPMLVLDRLRGESSQRISEQWAAALGAPVFSLDVPAARSLPRDWHLRARSDWEALYEPARLDFQVEQIKTLIRLTETLSGREFDAVRFVAEMQRINEAGEIVADIRNLLARARPAPIPLTEQLGNVMAATWNRGSEWSVQHLRRYRDEVKALIDNGTAACPNERLRLLWLNNGLWFNTGFYRAFEEKYGAVFVWSMYSDFLSDGYRRDFDASDPQSALRALASRHIGMNEQLHLPPMMADWIIHQARDFGADGAVMLVPVGDRLSAYGTQLCAQALERAGIPVLQLHASMVDERLWDDAAMQARVADFIEQRLPNRN